MTSPTLGDLTQIPVTLRPTQGLPALGTGAMVTLYNQDITNLVYVSYQQWFTPGLGNSIPIQPLTSITISAEKAIYVASLISGVASLMVLPEGSQANPSPAQIAAQINALGLATLAQQITQQTVIPNNISTTGVPLLNLGTQVLSTANTSIASGATATFPSAGNISINQPGMEILLSVEANAAAVNAEARIQVNWLDANANPLSTDTYWIYAGSHGNPHALYAKGPTDGLHCTITVQANGSAITVDQITVYLNSKIYTEWQFESTSMPGLANTSFGLSLQETSALVVGRRAPAAIGTGASDTTILGMHVGKVWVFANSGSGTSDLSISIQNAADQFGEDLFLKMRSDNLGNVNTYVNMPRAQCIFTLSNGNAATQTLRYLIISCAESVTN